jgi:hypothetical protein
MQKNKENSVFDVEHPQLEDWARIRKNPAKYWEVYHREFTEMKADAWADIQTALAEKGIVISSEIELQSCKDERGPRSVLMEDEKVDFILKIFNCARNGLRCLEMLKDSRQSLDWKLQKAFEAGMNYAMALAYRKDSEIKRGAKFSERKTGRKQSSGELFAKIIRIWVRFVKEEKSESLSAFRNFLLNKADEYELQYSEEDGGDFDVISLSGETRNGSRIKWGTIRKEWIPKYIRENRGS